MTERIRWEDGQWGNLVGYVGTIEPWAFQIWHITDAGHWSLTTSFPEHQAPISTSADPEKLKGRAEEWLTGFTASLGATLQGGKCECVISACECGGLAHHKQGCRWREGYGSRAIVTPETSASVAEDNKE